MNYCILRSLASLSKSPVGGINCRNIHSTSIRCKRREPLRKHVWLPRAPSKIFQIPEKVYLPRDEQDQVDHLNFHYEAQLLSIREYCRLNFYLPSRSAGGLSAEQVQYIEDEYERLLRENEAENQRVSEDRTRRETVARKEKEEQLLKQHLEVQEKNESIRRKAEKVAQMEVERSKTFITKEKLLGAIEEALGNPVSYEFAIDKRGNVITDGKIHPYAFTPNDIPDTSENVMLDDKGDIKFKANRIYIPKKFSFPETV